jgi:hypothetical protein
VGRRDVERGDGVFTLRDTRGAGRQQQITVDDLVMRLGDEVRQRRPA